MQNKINILNNTISWGFVALAFLTPLFFLPITTNFYDFNKNAFLVLITAILLIAWVAKMILTKEVRFKWTAFGLPVLALSTAFLLSVVFTHSNKFEAILSPGTTGTIIALTLLYFLITNNIKEQSARRIVQGLIASGTLLALIAIYQFIGLGEAFIPANTGLDWLRQKTFTPAGGSLVLATYLVVILPLAISSFLKKGKSLAGFFSTLIILGGLSLTVYQLFTVVKPILLPQTTGWAIAIETFKTSPLWGVGPANFLSAFTMAKPIAFNMSDYWGIWFGVSSNWYFHLLTTIGVVGLIAFLFLVWRVVKTTKYDAKSTLSFSLLISLALFALLPANFLLLTTLFFLLALLAVQLPAKEYTEESRLLPWTIFLPVLAFSLIAVYFYGRNYLAEFYFKKSIDAIALNQGGQAYNAQIQAIRLNPNQDDYRLAYSQTNFALANAIAAKTDLTDQDRQDISTLIQQAIQEAKAAVAVNPQNVRNWQNLAMLYRQLINFANGADSWAVAAYQQAIALDPTNPNLRISLGGIYYALGNWDEATKSFEQAVFLKSDFANAHYNLAAALREKGDFTRATQEMTAVLSLVPQDSDDYQKASSELDALKKKLAEEAEKTGKKPSETLNQPEPLPAGIKPPLDLPAEVQPEISPSPAPEATPTP